MSLTKKNVKNQEKFSRTCGFRGDIRESLNFHWKPSKIMIVRLDFRQNLLKVEKWPFWHNILHFWMIQIFAGKTLKPISYSYSKGRSGKKSENSLGQFSRKSDHQPTNYLTKWLKIKVKELYRNRSIKGCSSYFFAKQTIRARCQWNSNTFKKKDHQNWSIFTDSTGS